jgi:ribosome production factor 1
LRLIRQEAFKQIKQIAKKEKKARREKRKRDAEELGDKAPPKQKPKTLDTLREHDETFVLPADDEVAEDKAVDEFADHYAGKVEPKIMITTNLKASKESYRFIIELVRVIPNSTFYARRSYSLKAIVGYAKNKGFTHLIVINEDNQKLNGLLLIHLPNGPTALFKLSSIVLSKQIKGHASMSKHTPELMLNNFNTRLGHTVGRLLGSLFPYRPDFHGRRIITLHNQRDFIFFRQHRYVFESAEEARLQEMGPQFTLKLRSLQHGTFDTKFGEFEFVHKSENRPYARRKFVL